MLTPLLLAALPVLAPAQATDGGWQPGRIADLVVRHVDVFDSRTKQVRKDRTLVLHEGIIVALLDSDAEAPGKVVLDGRGRLAVPGFVDTHTHLKNVYGIGSETEGFKHAEELELDRSRLGTTFLPYGTTTIVDMGSPDKLLKTTLGWQLEPAPGFPNLYLSGGALASSRGRPAYINHAEVISPEAARAKVREYAELGLKHIKLYSWLRWSELESAVEEAQELELTVSGHIDRNGITISEVLGLGVRNFEHLLSLPSSVPSESDPWEAQQEKHGLPPITGVDTWTASILFSLQHIRETPALRTKLDTLLDEIASKSGSLSTTVHQLAAVAGRTSFFTSFGDDANQAGRQLPGYTDDQLELLSQAYDASMRILVDAHERGVKIRIGTDCRRGGEAMLSELRLLFEAGFPMPDVLQIATWNGAQAMGLDQVGVIEPGKRADLVLFEESPLADVRNLQSKRTVIQAGVVMGK